MNAKKAKALRQQLGYKPEDTRDYETLKVCSYLGKIREVTTTKVLREDSLRAQYQEAKKK